MGIIVAVWELLRANIILFIYKYVKKLLQYTINIVYNVQEELRGINMRILKLQKKLQ